jgi:transposase-like protein
MEEDIVERLRKESHGVTVNLNPWPTMREAADEIERLRAELKIQDEANDILSSTSANSNSSKNSSAVEASKSI